MHIIIADDHELFRDGLRIQLEKMDTDMRITECASHREAQEAVEKYDDVDMILYDLSMPEGNWRENLKSLKGKTDARLVILSASEAPDDIRDAMRIGVEGYIPKKSATRLLLDAVQLVMNGGSYLPPELMNVLARHKESAPESADHLSAEELLTPRQREVLQHLSEGRANKQIAYEMALSEATVKLHITALLRNLEVSNRTEAVVTAQKRGLI